MTIEIKETCSCGSEFCVKDTSEYGNTAKYRYQEFLNAHKICRKIQALKRAEKIHMEGNEVGNSESPRS